MPDSKDLIADPPGDLSAADSTPPAVRVKKLSDLTPDDRNANRGTARGSRAIAASLRKYGAGRSILLDRTGRIIAGNKTAENAAALDMGDVLVVQTDGRQLVAVQRMDLDLDSPAARELAIADNRSAELSLNWDADVLRGLSAEISLDEFFSADELESIWQAAAIQGDEDDVPALPSIARSRCGDLYLMGEHRLLCGDATSIEAGLRLMGSERADLLWTDPPYNVAYVGKTAEKLEISGDAMSGADFDQFLERLFSVSLQLLRPGGAAYICHADIHGEQFRRSFRSAGFHLAGGRVLDLCGGSGSTLIACEKTRRRCFMMELDPRYVDVIVDRWQLATGRQADLERAS